MSVPEQLVSATEQLRKCSGAVSKSPVAVISLPEQLEVFRSSFESVPDQLRKCSGAVTKVVPEQLVSVPEQLVSVLEQLLSLPEEL